MDTQDNIVCEVCNVHMHKNSYESHVNGKKHISKQEQYDKVHKSIFVSGVNKFTPESLKKIFRKYGEVSHVVKPKNNNVFAFIHFIDKSSVDKAMQDRLFFQGARFFIQKYSDNKNDLSKSGNLSEITSSTSQNKLTEGQVGVTELPVELADPSECPEGQSVFEWQVHQFISQVELPGEMYQCLNDVINDLEDIFNPVLPGCRIIVFGSCGTILAFKNSDVDLFLQSVGDQPEDFVKKEAKVMFRSRKLKIISRIPSARVPIVRFIHLTSGWHCDITAKSRLGVSNSRLIRFLISLDPRIRTLIMVIKFWAKVCEITGSNQKMTSYSLVMLVIFYLQQLNPPILPPVVTLQQLANKKEFNLGWECSFCDEEWTLRSASPAEENNSSLKELLSAFFHFYYTFDYNNVVCPLLGRTIPVSDFIDPDKLPSEMHLYKENLKSDPNMQFRTNVMLRMQDPFELCLNITRNVIDKTFIVFKAACKVSYDLCQKSDEGSLLKSLFTIKKGMIDIPDYAISKFHVNFKESLIKNTSASLESNNVQSYELIKEAILLVMKEICKLHVELTNFEISSKVKKGASSQDVHSSSNSSKGCEDLLYICNANGVVWDLRKKTQKVINRLNISLSDFEKEVLISECLYKPREGVLFSFNLSISSFEEFKCNGKSVDLIIKYDNPEVNSCFKKFLEFLKYNIINLVNLASLYIANAKLSSPEIEEKQLVKKLFDLKQELFAILKPSNNCKLEMRDKECPASEKEKIGQISQNLSNPIQTYTEGDVNEHVHNFNTTNLANRYQNQAEPLVSEGIEDSTTTDTEDQMMKSDSSPCVQFFKPNNTIDDKCFETLKTSQNIKTQPIFTCEEKNPFLASIEKVALKSVITHDSASDKINKSKYHEVQTKKKPENKSVELCDGRRDHEKETISFTSYESSSNSAVHTVEVKPNYNPSQQKRKVYLERLHKFKKPRNYRFAQYHFHNLHAENGVVGNSRNIEMGSYGHQMYSRRNITGESSHDCQYYGELDDSTRGNHPNKRHRYQQHSYMSTDKEKLWHPRRFKK